jgi:hypothetical protein
VTRRPTSAPGHGTGAGRVTLSRVGGGAGPDSGAYALLLHDPPGRTEAVIGYCTPDDGLLDPDWGLHPADRRLRHRRQAVVLASKVDAHRQQHT